MSHHEQNRSQSVIQLRNVSYLVDDETDLLSDLTTSFRLLRNGLIGKNGTGKTTTLKLISQQIKPSLGVVNVRGTIGYLPQDISKYLGKTVSSLLPNANESLYYELNMPYSLMERKLRTLSGGEQMKVILASILQNDPDFILLDEPTNNLDFKGKSVVYSFIENWKKGMIVVSHDRDLLNQMDKIYELHDGSIIEYGGGYDDYLALRETQATSEQHQVEVASQQLSRVSLQKKRVLQRNAKSSSASKKTIADRGIPRIIVGAMKQKNQSTTAKLKKIHEKKVTDAKSNLQAAKDNIRPENNITVDLSGTSVPNGKHLISFEKVTFGYSPRDLLFEDLHLEVYGPERIAITGENGSGKTTLVRLVLGTIQPLHGSVIRSIDRVHYLDQVHQTLTTCNTVVAFFQESFPNTPITRIHHWLSKFLFSEADRDKQVFVLSGGEKMRLSMALAMFGPVNPQVLILDEPTNNLDLDSVQQLESVLQNYQGALIVISHDKEFLRSVGINRYITLG